MPIFSGSGCHDVRHGAVHAAGGGLQAVDPRPGDGVLLDGSVPLAGRWSPCDAPVILWNLRRLPEEEESPCYSKWLTGILSLAAIATDKFYISAFYLH